MKKRILLSISLFVLALVSCGTKEDSIITNPDNTSSENDTNSGDNDNPSEETQVTFLSKAAKMTEELDNLPRGNDLTKSKKEKVTSKSNMLNSDENSEDEFGDYYKDITNQDLTNGEVKIGTDYNSLYGFATQQVDYLVKEILSSRDTVIEKVTQLDTWIYGSGYYYFLSYDINSDTVLFKNLLPENKYSEGVLTYNEKNELCLDFTIYDLSASQKSYKVNYIENEFLYCENYTGSDKEAYYYNLSMDTVDFYVFRYFTRENQFWAAHIIEKDGYYIVSENAYGEMQINVFDIQTEYRVLKTNNQYAMLGLYAFDMIKAVSYNDGSFKIKYNKICLSNSSGKIDDINYRLSISKEGNFANITLNYPNNSNNLASVTTAFIDFVGSNTDAMGIIQYLSDNYDYYINPMYMGVSMKNMTFDYFGDPIVPSKELLNSLIPEDYVHISRQSKDTTPYKMVEIAAVGTFSNFYVDKINISVKVTNLDDILTLYSYQYVLALKNNDEIIYVTIKPAGHKGDAIATTFTVEDIENSNFDIIFSKLKEYITAKDVISIVFGGEGNINIDQYLDFVYGGRENCTINDMLVYKKLDYAKGLSSVLSNFGFNLYDASLEEIQRFYPSATSLEEYYNIIKNYTEDEKEEAVNCFLNSRTNEEIDTIINILANNLSQVEMVSTLYDVINDRMKKNNDIYNLVINELNSMPDENKYSILEPYVSKYEPVLYLAVLQNEKYIRTSEFIFLNEFVISEE